MPRVLTAVVVLGLAAGIWYLRDPPWLISYTTGLRAWQRAEDGTAFRWSTSHASFFVPSDAATLWIPVSTTFGAAGGKPMLVTITIDDVRGARVLLEDPQWKDVTIALLKPGRRRVRRVDIRTSVTREGNVGVRIGELKVSHDGQHWRPCCFMNR
jgi:hypothetical protein